MSDAAPTSRLAVFAVIGAALFSIAWKSREEKTPPPSSSSALVDAVSAAMKWAALAPGREAITVLPSGSMLPLFGSNAVLGAEVTTAAKLSVGDVAIYLQPKTGVRIVHRVAEVRADGVLFDGDNNRGSDGWIPPANVTHRIAAIFYAQRPATA